MPKLRTGGAIPPNFLTAQQSLLDQDLLIIEASRSHPIRHTIFCRTPFAGPLPDNTRRLEETDNNAPGWSRTRNPSKRVAADLRLRLRGHCYRHKWSCTSTKTNVPITIGDMKCQFMYGPMTPSPSRYKST